MTIKSDWFTTIFAPIITFLLISTIALGATMYSEQQIIRERQNNGILKLDKYETEISQINTNINVIKMDVAELKIMFRNHIKNELTIKDIK